MQSSHQIIYIDESIIIDADDDDDITNITITIVNAIAITIDDDVDDGISNITITTVIAIAIDDGISQSIALVCRSR
jgi:hypothetical protein